MKEYLYNNLDFENPELISSIDELSIWSAPFGIKMLDVVEMKKNMDYLDVGFGTGFPLLELAQRLGNTCNATGIDPWNGAIARTSIKMNHYRLSNVKLVNGTAEKMPFADNSFDLITSNNGLNNVDDEIAAYSECFRVCKPGGQFVFAFNLPETFIEFYSIYKDVLKFFNKQEVIEKLNFHIHKKRKSVEETKKTVTDTGFKINQISTDVFQWCYANGSAMLNHWFIRLAFLTSWIEIPEKSEREIIFTELENRLNQLSEKNGCFKMTIPFAVFDCRK